jgi:hypothetical protein
MNTIGSISHRCWGSLGSTANCSGVSLVLLDFFLNKVKCAEVRSDGALVWVEIEYKKVLVHFIFETNIIIL